MRDTVALAKASTPTTTAKLTKDLLRESRLKSRRRREGRVGSLAHRESEVALRLFYATVAAPIIIINFGY